jgi:hypothetical protein
MMKDKERPDWFNQAPERMQEEVDPDLVELGGRRGDQSPVRPFLMVLVLVLGGYIIHDWREELEYFMQGDEPVVIGSVTDFPSKAEAGQPVTIPHNRYVEIEGIPSKRSISPKAKFFKLIGGEVYVEAPRDDAHLSELEREAQGKPLADTDRTYFKTRGRAIDMARAPGRYAGLRQYYRTRYQTVFCVDLLPGQREELDRRQREQLKLQWSELWTKSSEAERKELGLSAAQLPPDRLEEMMRDSPVCVDATLIQAEVSPKAHWWYAALTGLFGLFMLADLVFLIGWLKRFLAPRDI